MADMRLPELQTHGKAIVYGEILDTRAIELIICD
jgi:hypothetical protein